MRRAEVLKFEDRPDLKFDQIAPIDRRALTIGIGQWRLGWPKPTA